jgi:nitrogen fixation protein
METIGVVLDAYRAYFVKKETAHKISVLQEKQEGGSVLRMTNAFIVRLSRTYLGYS